MEIKNPLTHSGCKKSKDTVNFTSSSPVPLATCKMQLMSAGLLVLTLALCASIPIENAHASSSSVNLSTQFQKINHLESLSQSEQKDINKQRAQLAEDNAKISRLLKLHNDDQHQISSLLNDKVMLETRVLLHQYRVQPTPPLSEKAMLKLRALQHQYGVLPTPPLSEKVMLKLKALQHQYRVLPTPAINEKVMLKIRAIQHQYRVLPTPLPNAPSNNHP